MAMNTKELTYWIKELNWYKEMANKAEENNKS